MTIFDVVIGAVLIAIFTAFLFFSGVLDKMKAQDRAAIDAQKTGTDEENTKESLEVLPRYIHSEYLDHYYLYRRSTDEHLRNQS